MTRRATPGPFGAGRRGAVRGCISTPRPLPNEYRHRLARAALFFSPHVRARRKKPTWVIKLPAKSPQSLSLISLDMRPKRKWFRPRGPSSTAVWAERIRNNVHCIRFIYVYNV